MMRTSSPNPHELRLSVPTQRPVPSPCISVCTMHMQTQDDAESLCSGCYRTLNEIAHWSVLDDAEKLAVWAQLETRRLACARSPA